MTYVSHHREQLPGVTLEDYTPPCGERRVRVEFFGNVHTFSLQEFAVLADAVGRVRGDALADAKKQAREVASLFSFFDRSSHRFHDGRPLHVVAAELLLALADGQPVMPTTSLPSSNDQQEKA